ncbi:MAG: pseudouridine synthase [Oscillospiraceae bacterium]
MLFLKERLQKILSAQGICSRRTAEEYIKNGAVKVNGITAFLGDSADIDEDEITLNDVSVKKQENLVYIMLYKPRGYVTTMSDEASRHIVTELITDVGTRVYPVGRLDMHSEGLLIMTNDGAMANKLMHPSNQVYKQYLVKMTCDTDEPIEPAEIMLSKPMIIDDKMTAPAKCRLILRNGTEYIVTIAIREGRNRQIRKMCTNCGFTVNSLKRVAEGNIKLGDLQPGKWRYLTEAEIAYLKTL